MFSSNFKHKNCKKTNLNCIKIIVQFIQIQQLYKDTKDDYLLTPIEMEILLSRFSNEMTDCNEKRENGIPINPERFVPKEKDCFVLCNELLLQSKKIIL